MVQDADKPTDPMENPVSSVSPQTPGQGDGSQHDTPVEAGTSEIEPLREELEALKDKYLRALAEYQNSLKRAAAERADAARRGQADLAKALLPVLDNFERTLHAARSAKDIRSVVHGVKIVHDQLLKVLGEYGLRRMTLARGDPFDPTRHQAVAQHATDQVEPEHVFHVAQPGYTMNDLLLRPATVVVAKPVGPAGKPGSQSQASDEVNAEE
jgi:molecular chaperone GrpE